MTTDTKRLAALEAAFEMARTGTFQNSDEVEEALSLSESGLWHECLTEPAVQEQIDALCRQARTRISEDGGVRDTLPQRRR